MKEELSTISMPQEGDSPPAKRSERKMRQQTLGKGEIQVDIYGTSTD